MSVKDALAGGGWIVALVVGLSSFVGGVGVGDVADPIDKAPTIVVAPASGIEGYDALLFCNDPLTTLKPPKPAPDAPIVWELTRTRDLKTETVVYVEGAESGLHYYDTAIGQQSEPAVMSDEARECIDGK